jgi:hypothetical protein
MHDQQPHLAGAHRAALPIEGWAAIAAAAFILLSVIATLPGIPW